MPKSGVHPAQFNGRCSCIQSFLDIKAMVTYVSFKSVSCVCTGPRLSVFAHFRSIISPGTDEHAPSAGGLFLSRLRALNLKGVSANCKYRYL